MSDKVITSGALSPYRNARSPGIGQVPYAIVIRAYEVYYEVYYGSQPTMIDLEGRNCRGRFGIGDLLVFLYARSFPKSEWRQRVDEAFRGMEL